MPSNDFRDEASVEETEPYADWLEQQQINKEREAEEKASPPEEEPHEKS